MRGTSMTVLKKIPSASAWLLALLFCGCWTVASAATNEGATPTPPDYRISPEDVMQVTVWKEEGMDREVIVRPDGGISYPLVGNIMVAGKTPAEVESEIA